MVGRLHLTPDGFVGTRRNGPAEEWRITNCRVTISAPKSTDEARLHAAQTMRCANDPDKELIRAYPCYPWLDFV